MHTGLTYEHYHYFHNVNFVLFNFRILEEYKVKINNNNNKNAGI